MEYIIDNYRTHIRETHEKENPSLKWESFDEATLEEILAHDVMIAEAYLKEHGQLAHLDTVREWWSANRPNAVFALTSEEEQWVNKALTEMAEEQFDCVDFKLICDSVRDMLVESGPYRDRGGLEINYRINFLKDRSGFLSEVVRFTTIGGVLVDYQRKDAPREQLDL